MKNRILIAATIVAVTVATVPAQTTRSANGPRIALNAADERERQARIALTGDLGFPPLPAVTLDSPRDTILYADRMDFSPFAPTQPASAGGPTMVSVTIPAAQTGTGFAELMEYQLPTSYDPEGAGLPLLIALHGFGSSKSSCANQSTLDEEAESRGWVYLSPTGLDDQLFGSPICQKHIEIAIQHMLDNFNIDADRIYMVGFSMGGGIALNFAARHRDPNGLMIAAVGTVAAGLDWAQSYTTQTLALQQLMEHPYNFGGSPSAQPFRYRQASALHMDLASYPPLPGLLDVTQSMASNLAGMPVYITYDDQDLIPGIQSLNELTGDLLVAQGCSVFVRVQSNTQLPGPPSIPAPHSWYVLDEQECLDHIAGAVVERHPAEFAAQQDLGGPVSWVTTTQAQTSAFTYVDAVAEPNEPSLTIGNLDNASELVIDVAAAGISGTWPIHVKVTNVDSEPTRVKLTNFDLSPSRLHQYVDGALVTLVDSDPIEGALFVDVAGGSTLDVRVVHDPNWTTKLTISPDPVALLQDLTFTIDGPSTSVMTYLVVAAFEFWVPVETLVMTALPVDPAVIFLLGLDANGDTLVPATMPGDPILQGLRLPTQAVTVGPTNALESVSNLWGFYIE